MKGIIFDIQRSSLNDGPGIRTTVFLKGCPLKCIWCHNPESQSFQPQLSYDEEKCQNCFKCIPVCPKKAHYQKDNRHFLDFSKCSTAGKCVPECAYGALKLIGREIDTEEIIHELEKDKDYFDNSGGGLTVSGGEPMSQFEFTLELLKKAKEKNIHTCLDTCGEAPEKHFGSIFPFVDIFLYDFKITSPEEHKKYTGADNKLIMSNLDYLYNKGGKIILRCPVIPGINDTEEHFKGIAEIAARYPGLLGVEILAYHDMARGKARQIGISNHPVKSKTVDEQTRQEWIKKIKIYNNSSLLK